MSIFQKNSKKVQKNIRIVVVTVCVSLLCILIIVVSSMFKLKDLQVTGCDYYTEEEITDYFKNSVLEKNTVIFYLKYKFFQSVSIPFVDDFDMDFVNRNKIHINIYEKAMISCMKYMGEYLYLDKDGTIVEVSHEKVDGIPLVTGVHFKEMNLHKQLKVDDESIFNTILTISSLIRRYELDIDRIYFDYKYEVTLFSGKIKILLGKKEYLDTQIADLTNILPITKERKLEGVLDMREYTGDQSKIIFRENKFLHIKG